MKLSVFNPSLGHMPLNDMLAFLKAEGLQAVEVGCGGYPGKAHCDPAALLKSGKALTAFKDSFKRAGLEIAALSCHGNPVHPDKAEAKRYHDDFVLTLRLAEKLGIDRVVGFSGCPGGSAKDMMPNWVTCGWPEEYPQILDYQWNEVLIPYWQKTAKVARDHGVNRIAFEMHPGFCVYNPETLLKLRAHVGPTIGANVDPSHLFWQGIDPVMAIRLLGEAVYFFHAKDTYVDAANTAQNGVLDTKNYGDFLARSWTFRTVGYGHDSQVWKQIISSLRMVGYDDVISIEHEDGLMSFEEGLKKAIRFLKDVLMFEGQTEMFWA